MVGLHIAKCRFGVVTCVTHPGWSHSSHAARHSSRSGVPGLHGGGSSSHAFKFSLRVQGQHVLWVAGNLSFLSRLPRAGDRLQGGGRPLAQFLNRSLMSVRLVALSISRGWTLSDPRPSLHTSRAAPGSASRRGLWLLLTCAFRSCRNSKQHRVRIGPGWPSLEGDPDR